MLIAEARWIGEVLARLPDSAFPLANVGSQTAEFQDVTQPWIGEHVTDPVRARGGRVVNIDIRDDPAVDVVADVTTPEGQRRIRDTGARTFLCANVLEHVPDPRALFAGLQDVVPVGGTLVVTGPLAFPYHPDPIDTMFRPSWDEVAAWLGGDFEVIAGADVTCRRLVAYDTMTPYGRARVAARVLLPFVKPAGWRERMRWLATPTSCYALAARRLG